jgi:diacylglycerol kinase (ATP)
MGLVPSGTGNDMARGLGIPHEDADAAIARLLEKLDRRPRTIDAARMSWTDARTGAAKQWYFACMLSAGFDAIVNERANHMTRPKGASRYILAMLIELAKLKPIAYRLDLDGEQYETDASLVAVGNAVSLGGGMKLTPDAKLEDGLLDVAVVQPLSRIGFLRLFPKVFDGTHVKDPRVAIYRARRIRIEADVVAYADGERVAPLPIDIEVAPAALRVLA